MGGEPPPSLPVTSQDGPPSGETSILATALYPNPWFMDEETEAGACPGWQQEYGGVEFGPGPSGSRPPCCSVGPLGARRPEQPGPWPSQREDTRAERTGDGDGWGPLP